MKNQKIIALAIFGWCLSISVTTQTSADSNSQRNNQMRASSSDIQDSHKPAGIGEAFWNLLDPGIYAVGFKPIYKYDHTRSYRVKSDPAGNPTAGEVARPMPVYVWYPALKSDAAQSMLFQDYVFLRAVEDEFGNLDEEKKRFAKSWYRGYSGAPNVSEKIISEILTLKTKAFMNVKAQKGEFPLIIYAPGYSEGGHENTVLAEYLASHGYIVAMTPMRGMFARTDDDYMTGIEAQTRDLAFVAAEMRSFPNLHPHQFGLIGFDEGGLSGALLALQNSQVDAIVYLDGSIGFRTEEILERFPYFTGSRLQSAYLEAIGSVKKFGRDPATFKPVFYDGIRYADAYSLRFKNLAHDEFTSDHLMNYVHTGHDTGSIKTTEIDAGYAAMCRYLLHFLNAYVKKEERSLIYLKNRPEENNLPAGMLQKFSKTGLRFPTERRAA